MNLELRKLSIIEYLAELQDEVVIQQIENLLKPRSDFWEELSSNEKAIIKKGIEDLNQGNKIEFKKFMKKLKKDKS